MNLIESDTTSNERGLGKARRKERRNECLAKSNDRGPLRLEECQCCIYSTMSVAVDRGSGAETISTRHTSKLVAFPDQRPRSCLGSASCTEAEVVQRGRQRNASKAHWNPCLICPPTSSLSRHAKDIFTAFIVPVHD
jgi:hypothetical protein